MLIRIALFRPGRIFPQYIARVTKAVIPPRQSTDWATPDIRSADRGIRGARDLSYKFQNYAAADDFARLTQVSNLSTEFGQSAFFSPYSCCDPTLRRYECEGRPSRTGPRNPPQDHKVLVGVRTLGGQQILRAEVPWRKNLQRGCILRRPCLFQDALPMATALYAALRIWPHIRLRVRTNDLKSPPFSAGDSARR